MELRTNRLLLRQFKDEDFNSFCQLNADPEVMRYFSGTQSKQESQDAWNRIAKHWQKNNFGFYSTILKDTQEFVGFVGIQRIRYECHFVPNVEVGWRLHKKFWNRGFATEAAHECLRFGFEELNLPEIVAVTVPINSPSRRVMEKLGMTYDRNGDFENPLCPKGDWTRYNVLYRLNAEDFKL